MYLILQDAMFVGFYNVCLAFTEKVVFVRVDSHETWLFYHKIVKQDEINSKRNIDCSVVCYCQKKGNLTEEQLSVLFNCQSI